MGRLAAALLAAAVAAAERGWSVFPCRPNDKRPAIDRWEQRASADPEHVADAWRLRFRGFNIGIACGPSRLAVVDLDCHGELPDEWRAIPGVADGRDVFRLLLEWAGQPGLPATYRVATPSGGWHLYFRAPDEPPIRNSAGMLGPGVDVRAQGGFVVGVGSVIGQRRYTVLDAQAPADLPAWLRRRLDPSQAAAPVPVTHGPVAARLRGMVEHVEAGQPGDRNGRLYWAARRLGEMVTAGHASAADGELLVAAALRAGLRGGESEARSTLESGLRAGGGR